MGRKRLFQMHWEDMTRRRGKKRGKKWCLNVLTWKQCIVGTVGLGLTTGAEGQRWVSLCSVTAHVHAQNGS